MLQAERYVALVFFTIVKFVEAQELKRESFVEETSCLSVEENPVILGRQELFFTVVF